MNIHIIYHITYHFQFDITSVKINAKSCKRWRKNGVLGDPTIWGHIFPSKYSLIMEISSNDKCVPFTVMWFSGFHRHFCWWDVCQAHCHGSILLLPGRVELLWRLHCNAEFGWAGTSWRGRSVCTQVIPIGKSVHYRDTLNIWRSRSAHIMKL